MVNHRNDRQAAQGAMALFAAMFPTPTPTPTPAALPARRRNAVAVNARKAARPQKAPAARSRLQQAICHGLLAVALGSGMVASLVAYNFRGAIEAQAAQWVMMIKG